MRLFRETDQSIDASKAYQDYILMSRYSRTKADGRKETFEEAVDDRVMPMHLGKLKDDYGHALKDERFMELFRKGWDTYRGARLVGSQRALQFAGPGLRKHEAKMYNCWTTYIDRPDVFGEIMYVLLCGGGVGFSIVKEVIGRMPEVVQPDAPRTYMVADSIEGWADAVKALTNAYFKGASEPVFDFSLVRPAGAPISGGFIAPGPSGLAKSLEAARALLSGAVGRRLKSIEAHDIICHLADAVLSGGVRRSALISVFSFDDMEMRNAKAEDFWWDLHPQRTRANNSMLVIRSEITRKQLREVMDVVERYGEPGVIFAEDKLAVYNPCCEIGQTPYYVIDGEMHSGWQCCNLTDINGAMVKSREDFFLACEASAILGTIQSLYTDIPYLGPVTKLIMEHERLLGCSITGYFNALGVLGDAETLRKGADIINRVNEEMAGILGIRPSARLTTIKPSGTTSALLGTASGAHPEHSKYYLRHVMANKMEPLANKVLEVNPVMVQPSDSKPDDYVLAFPRQAVEGTPLKDEVNGVKQMEWVKFLYENWVTPGTHRDRAINSNITHNVSNTILVKPGEWDDVTDYMYENRAYFSGLSFLKPTVPYPQAPFTTIYPLQEIAERHGFEIDGPYQKAVLSLIRKAQKLNQYHDGGFGVDVGFNFSQYMEHSIPDHIVNEMRWGLMSWKLEALELFMSDRSKNLWDVFREMCDNIRYQEVVDNYSHIEWGDYQFEQVGIHVDQLAGQACSGGACDINI